MFRVNRMTLPHAGFSLRITRSRIRASRKTASFVVLSLLVLLLSNYVRANDLTGMDQDDPKDEIALRPASSQQPCDGSGQQFLPLPSWSHVVEMPPLPYQLKPDGKKPVALAPPGAITSEPLAPPKLSSVVVIPAPTETSPAAIKKAASDPDLVAVSPFLQWIKANPQAAAAQARQQADNYHTTPTPEAAPSNPAATTTAPTGSAAPPQDPYWLPPLIDSSTISAGSSGGSAAIYSRPQR
jgi:hypothetical protein